MIKRIGERVVSGQKYTLRPGVYAVLRQNDDVLMTIQSEPSFEFLLPGGGIDPGEHPLAALHREVFEETGWSVAGARRLGAFRRFTYMEEYDLWAEKVCSVYLARPGRRLGSPSESFHTPIWMTYDEAIAASENDGDRMFLTMVFEQGLHL